jgi:hypothetical protein
MTRTLSAKHKAALVAGRQRKAQERQREREQRLRRLGLEPVKRHNPEGRPWGWWWQGVNYGPDLDDMIRAIVRFYTESEDEG